MTNASIPLPDRGVLAIGGEDRRSFLQGLVTQDIAALPPGEATYALLLTPQGKYLHDFFVINTGETFLLEAASARLADLERRLRLYMLRAKVTVEDCTAHYDIGAALETDCPQGSASAEHCFRDPRHPGMGWRVLWPAGAAPDISTDLAVYTRKRLALGLPDTLADLQPETSFPPEYRFDAWHAISYTKGCYVGQEPIARAHHRGTLRKLLYRVEVTDGPLPEPGTPVMRGEKPVGEMRSGLEGRALALLRIEAAQTAFATHIDPPLVAGASRIMPLPWEDAPS